MCERRGAFIRGKTVSTVLFTAAIECSCVALRRLARAPHTVTGAKIPRILVLRCCVHPAPVSCPRPAWFYAVLPRRLTCARTTSKRARSLPTPHAPPCAAAPPPPPRPIPAPQCDISLCSVRPAKREERHSHSARWPARMRRRRHRAEQSSAEPCVVQFSPGRVAPATEAAVPFAQSGDMTCDNRQAMLGEHDDEVCDAAYAYGRNLGMAFQVPAPGYPHVVHPVCVRG